MSGVDAGYNLEIVKRLLRQGAINVHEARAMLGIHDEDFEHFFIDYINRRRQQKTILVTGGSGFIGSNFIHYILDKYPDYTMINLDKLTYAANPANHAHLEGDERYIFIKGDICDAELLDKIASRFDIDMIVHFAAESHVDRSINGPEVFLNANILGTHNLLQMARRHGNIRFHHISTDEVFGSLDLDDKDIFHERSRYTPRSPYSASKAAADHIVRAFYHTYDLPVTISNCSNNYGRYMHPEKMMPLFITNLMEGKKVPLYGDGLHIRDWLHVKDHCRAIDLIVHRGKTGHTYCVGGDNEVTNKDITYLILKLMGRSEEYIEHVVDRPGHDRRYAIDSSKLRNELGWKPLVPFEKGMRDMVQWYIENEDWWKKIKSGEYREYYAKQYGG